MALATAAAKPAALCIKPSAASPSSASLPSSAAVAHAGLMSKEWVVPPRPKPGRKPAIDTPPTKRKAQNRAAQRAFRERRAARVGELEDQMEQMHEEYEQETESLHAEINRLQRQAEQHQSEIAAWIERYRSLEKQLPASADSVPLPRQKRPPPIAGQWNQDESVVGCGRCSTNTNCQCLDNALDAMTASTNDGGAGEKRPSTAAAARNIKRVKLEASDEFEIDFTQIYASKAAPATLQPKIISPTPTAADRCGFCQDGTPCICAEMAAEAVQGQATSPLTGVADECMTDRLEQTAQFTPPPSEGDVTSTQQAASSNNCAGGPGTCAQCRTDPNSTLFCKSLAASRSQSASVPDTGCCGGPGVSDACCQRTGRSTRSTRSKLLSMAKEPSATPPQGVTLTCADAFTTLSRHPAYEKATGEIASWMPKLHANDAKLGGRSVEDRPAMEIDAANVMTVLREFDRRFGVD